MRLDLTVDGNNQWFVPAWVAIGGKCYRVRFKVDTGCNSLVLSHSTLKNMGFSVSEDDLSKLPFLSGKLASGKEDTFVKLGAVSLCQDKNQAKQICKANAICHSTHETHDLLGTEVLRRFSSVTFNLFGNKYMELK